MDPRRPTLAGSPRADARRRRARRAGLLALAASIGLALPAANSGAQSLGAEVDAKAGQVAAARAQAAAAAAREAQLSTVLAQGQQREAELEVRVQEGQAQLARTKAHLRRALAELSARLVSIYKGDAPDATALLLNSRGFDDLANRAELLGRIEDADAGLAAAVRQLRDQVAAEL